MEPIITVSNLRHIYPDKTEVKVRGLDFIVHQGERVVILGPNGAGKTTLISHILGLLAPVEGTVSVLGMEPSKHFNEIRKGIGVVFQNVDEQIIGPRVYDDIAFSLVNEGYSKENIKERVENVAKSLGIESLLNKIPHYLSGGQRKKVALAGAMVMMPKILILDEPFDALDPLSKAEMIHLLNHLNHAHQITLIITTHDINVVPDIADKIYVINQGEIITCGSPQEVFLQGETLQAAQLEPPILTKLFSRLQQRGLPVAIPQDVKEAETMLMDLYQELLKKQA